MCETSPPNANDLKVNDESIFRKKKQDWKILRRGYVYAFISSLLISGGSAAKYHFFIRNENLRRTDVFIVNWALLFTTFFIVTFLLARWYYKVKDKENEYLKRRYWNE